MFAISVVAFRKLGAMGEGGTRVALAGLAVSVLLAVGIAWAWPMAPLTGARTLDRHYGFHDRLASSISFSALPVARRTLFMVAAMADAVSLARAAHPERAVPLRLPRSLPAAALLVGVLGLTSLWEVRSRVRMPGSRAIEAVAVAPDDIDEVRDYLTRARSERPAEDVKTALDQFERLVDDIANHRIDRAETFRRLDALDRALAARPQGDPKALEAILEQVGAELRKSQLARPAGDALVRSQIDEAAAQVRRLAERMRPAGVRPDPDSMERLRDALSRAAARIAQRRQELEDRRRRLDDELLKRRASGGDGGAEHEEGLLKDKQRELERLDRETSSESAGEPSVDRLDRELEQAASDLAKDLGVGADDLERGAEDLSRMAEQRATDREKEELRDKLRELSELVRQQGGSAGQQRLIRVQRFGQVARGQARASGAQGPDGPSDGHSNEGPEGSSESERADSQGRDAQRGGQRAGSGGETWVLGPNGEKMLLLSRGAGAGARPEPGTGGSGGLGSASRSWGDEHDPNLRGKPTQLKSATVDTEISASDTGQGATRSQVILGAAQRGFVSEGYRKVFTEYHAVAEQSLARQDIPGGYRYYVKRYFQLIRPRDGR
ncbi:MAG: hypothetical protein ABTD50_05175 [Polyangiaceae bacterium]|jgi:hypothetical protein